MSADHAAEEDLVMLYYREPGTPEKLREHLDECPACRAAYQNLVRVLDACDDVPVPEPHAAFESRIWNRLEPQLHPIGQRVSPWEFVRLHLQTRWFAMAAVAAMLAVAFFAGRVSKPQEPARIVAITADGRQRVLLTALGDHIERSEMVLSELANGVDQAGDLSMGRERARNLISENRLYRQSAAESGDPGVAQVLDELERVLLDISHGTDSSEIKSRIDSESLLFKLRVLGSTLNRTTPSTQMPAQEKTL
jgi:hypothetical protein